MGPAWDSQTIALTADGKLMIYDNFHPYSTNYLEAFVIHEPVRTFFIQEHGNTDYMTSLNQLKPSITDPGNGDHSSCLAVMIGTATWTHCSIAVRIELLLESLIIIILPKHYCSPHISSSECHVWNRLDFFV